MKFLTHYELMYVIYAPKTRLKGSESIMQQWSIQEYQTSFPVLSIHLYCSNIL